MKIFKILTKDVLLHSGQGYALFYYHQGQVLENVNGKVSDKDSDNITFKTNFRLASVSKQFIAFGIVKLIQNNYLSYHTNIKEIYPNLPEYFSQITIKNLLNHTSGIYDYENIPHNNDDDLQILDQDVFDFLKTTNATYFEPGTKYRYSNTAYILLGLIIEKISGFTIGEYLAEVFKEAGMINTKVNYQGKTNIKNRAYGHLIDNNNELFVKDQYWCSATIGDGGLYSSVNDLKAWCKYLAKSQEFKEMKIPNYIGPSEYNEYGLGIRIIKVNDKEIFYHCGDTIGTNTLLLWSEELELCLIFLTNLGNIDTSIMKDNLISLLDKGGN